jgi:hypothetical protein
MSKVLYLNSAVKLNIIVTESTSVFHWLNRVRKGRIIDSVRISLIMKRLVRSYV